MTTIYFKSPDERTVVSLRGRNPKPDKFMVRDGYQQIDPNEFRRLKRRILYGLKSSKVEEKEAG